MVMAASCGQKGRAKGLRRHHRPNTGGFYNGARHGGWLGDHARGNLPYEITAAAILYRKARQCGLVYRGRDNVAAIPREAPRRHAAGARVKFRGVRHQIGHTHRLGRFLIVDGWR